MKHPPKQISTANTNLVLMASIQASAGVPVQGPRCDVERVYVGQVIPAACVGHVNTQVRAVVNEGPGGC